MPKYYIMLVDETCRQLRVPVKALLNPSDQRPAFCAGMPQFFGGTDDKDQPPAAVLDQEITQESRRTLELTSGSPPYFFTSGNMYFYWAAEDRWQRTDTPWAPGQNAAEREMDRIVIVDLTPFDPAWDDDSRIAELLNQTQSQSAPQQGRTDFAGSATREAFVELFRLLLD